MLQRRFYTPTRLTGGRHREPSLPTPGLTILSYPSTAIRTTAKAATSMGTSRNCPTPRWVVRDVHVIGNRLRVYWKTGYIYKSGVILTNLLINRFRPFTKCNVCACALQIQLWCWSFNLFLYTQKSLLITFLQSNNMQMLVNKIL